MSLRRIFEVVQSFNWMSGDISDPLTLSFTHTHTPHTHNLLLLLLYFQSMRNALKNMETFCMIKQCAAVPSVLFKAAQRHFWCCIVFCVQESQPSYVLQQLVYRCKNLLHNSISSSLKHKLLLCQHKHHGNCWEQGNVCLSVLHGKIISVVLCYTKGTIWLILLCLCWTVLWKKQLYMNVLLAEDDAVSLACCAQTFKAVLLYMRAY